MKRKRIIFVCCVMLGVSMVGQETDLYTNKYKEYNKALILYKRKSYRPALFFFEQEQKKLTSEIDKENCKYYIASTLLRLKQEGGKEKMEEFLNQYPATYHYGRASLDLGDYYFENSDFKMAEEWYDKVDAYQVERVELDRFYFQKGYALFANGKEKEAQPYFEAVGKNGEYKDKATYYLGYIAYDTNDYSQAKELFNHVNDEKLGEGVSYYKAHMSFQEGNYEEAIKRGGEQLGKTTDANEISEINKIIGESYFKLEKYEESIPYLEKYNGKNGEYTNTDHYYIGYAYYKKKDYQSAINRFNKIIEGQNEVAQNAYYHLGECYLNLGMKQEALNAFRNSSQMDFNKEIKKDAMYNYAKISYEIGNAYESVPSVIQNYMNTYPGDKDAELKPLLINSYITTGDYSSAIAYLEKNNKEEERDVYYEVCFYRGIELYDGGDYIEALKYFNKGKSAKKTKVSGRAYFWSGEVNYALHNYEKSEEDLKKFVSMNGSSQTDEYNDGFYSLGYVNFNSGKFAEAIGYFDEYLSKENKDSVKRSDAQIRKADSYFALGKYWPAMDEYKKIVDAGSGNADYATYQKSISYGFVGRPEKKIEELLLFKNKFVKSNLREQALFELGNTYVSGGENEKGLLIYQEIQKEYKKSLYVSRAMVREGLVYYNSGKNEQALRILKEVTEKYPRTSEAVQAVNVSKLVYTDMGKVDEYAKWAKSLGYINVDDAEIETASFEAAEKFYIQNKMDEAKVAIESYLKKFPNGADAMKGNFYLGQIYFNEGKKKEAKVYYEKVFKGEYLENREQTLARLSNIYLEGKEVGKAEEVLRELEKTSTIEQNVMYAKSNLMKILYEKKKYQEAITYSKEVLGQKNLDNRIKNDANLIMARSYMGIGDEGSAEKYYSVVKKNANGAVMAEAIYYEAYFKHKSGGYKKSNEIIQKLAKDYGGYKEISGRGLILMAKNFNKMNDDYQATYILNSVIENFSQYKDIQKEAKETLDSIKTKK